MQRLEFSGAVKVSDAYVNVLFIIVFFSLTFGFLDIEG
jgi:hypothetical protein